MSTARMDQVHDDMRIQKALSDAMALNTATPLVKEELRLSIMLRRLVQGKDELVVDFNAPKKYELTENEVLKIDRRRRQNRKAARKFRLNKKMKTTSLLEIVEKEESRKKELEEEIQELTAQKRNLLAEIEERVYTYCNTSHGQKVIFAIHTQMAISGNDLETRGPYFQRNHQAQHTNVHIFNDGNITAGTSLNQSYDSEFIQLASMQMATKDVASTKMEDIQIVDTEMVDEQIPEVGKDVQKHDLHEAPSVGEIAPENNPVNVIWADHINTNISDLVTISVSDIDMCCARPETEM